MHGKIETAHLPPVSQQRTLSSLIQSEDEQLASIETLRKQIDF